MPKPPEGENPLTPWPDYPLVLKTSSSHEEGCTRRWSLDTRKFTGENGSVKSVEVEEVEWISSADGKSKINYTGRKEFIQADLVLLAMGFVHPVREGLVTELNLKLDNRQNIDATDNRTSVNNVFAAGDAISGASLVVRAIDSGRKAAAAIERAF
jgi:glutamate synthase (NADPH/NADH) small chain